MTKVSAYPVPFPMEDVLVPERTALLVIDVQIDFCAPGGYMDRAGVDLTPLRKAIEPIQRVLAAMREKGYTIVHTRETFRPDLSDVQPHRRFRGVNGDAVGHRRDPV